MPDYCPTLLISSSVRSKWPPQPRYRWVSPFSTAPTMASVPIRAYARADESPNPPGNPSPRASHPPRPLPQNAVDHGNRFSIAQRVQCLTLIAEGFSGRDIEKKTGVKPSAQSYIKKKAFERGFRPDQDPRILDHYVVDGPRSGRPKKITIETVTST
jgi:hypothetical protein